MRNDAGVAAGDQIEHVLGALRDVLGPDLAGAYLFGSAVVGGLRPRSDLDVLAVSKRRTTRDEKRELVERLLEISLRPRPVELTIVIASEVRPWRYPPRMDFQYGDWWRDEFESGNVEPYPTVNTDLASLISMVLLADRPLVGPPPAEVLDPVPRADWMAAITGGADALLDDAERDTRNVVLTLARIWSSVETGEIRSKDDAAAWALPRLPAEHRPVLERARAIYLGEADEGWDDLRAEIAAYAGYVVRELRRGTARAS